MTGIYCLTSPSGKSYVGQSVDISRRLYNYEKYNCKKQPKLYNALLKYGFDKFKIYILEECDIKDLDEYESFWISYLETVNNGYNLSYGGYNRQLLISSKNKISSANKGKRISEYTKKLISISQKGRKVSDITRMKIKKSQTGKLVPKERLEKKINTDRTKNIFFGIYRHKGCNKFYIRFRQNGIKIYKSGFSSLIEAKKCRDEQLSKI